MPHWIFLLALAVIAWLFLSVVGGFAIGRLIDAAARALTAVFRPRLH
jgi:hypothetical protein